MICSTTLIGVSSIQCSHIPMKVSVWFGLVLNPHLRKEFEVPVGIQNWTKSQRR